MSREPSPINDLAEQAKDSQAVLGVIAAFQGQANHFLLSLDSALADLQRDPGDVGERIKRALVLRGTTSNILNRAFEEKVKAEENRT